MSESEGEIRIKVFPAEIVVDREKGIKVKEGIPTHIDHNGTFNEPGTEVITVPDEPHVFTVNELTIKDEDYPAGIKLEDARVIVGHGIASENDWRFVVGGEVVETVQAYNRYADETGQSQIEVAIVCNPKETHFGEGKYKIRVGNFPAGQPIAYAVGEDVSVTQGEGRSSVKNGKSFMEIRTNDKLFGLDRVIEKHQSRSIQSKIRILF